MEQEILLYCQGYLLECQAVAFDHFAEQLLNGVDLVSDQGRCKLGMHGLPNRGGIIEDLTRFDASFFGVHSKQANVMDPQMRLMIELTHEAIVDAGLNPTSLRGTKTSVFVSVPYSETEEHINCNSDNASAYSMMGCHRSMFANRISYTFDFKGPSYAIDAACCSSMCSFVQAYNAIEQGLCENAFVVASTLCLSPKWFVLCDRMKVLSHVGRCASFDEKSDGYVRSEAVVVVFLQKRRDARRVYATVRGAGMNVDGCKPEGITFPSGAMQRRLAEEVYAKAGLKPQDVVYVETHGAGTPVGDPQEVNAIADFFCKDRINPLLMGSVKSNMGHSEAASGLSSIAKVLIAMERGIIPGNLHYHTPNPEIPALSDGRIRVVDHNMKWEGGLAGVNSFGFGGANGHVILQSEEGSRPPPALYAVPRLLLASGRTKNAVQVMLSHGSQHATDYELHALIDAVHADPIIGHSWRGYTLLTDSPKMEVFEKCIETRPVWLVFSGMGSQWPGMARSLMQLPVFAVSIQNMAKVLAPYGMDLINIVTNANESSLSSIIESFVSITAVQVAQVDLLKTIGIEPNGIVGHSVGEIGCAYADGAITADEAILAAYWRGRSVEDANLVPGAMAAVGLSWEECILRCPPDVIPACDNASDLVTVSGPVEAIEKFITQMTSEQVFVRRVNNTRTPFHTKHVAPAGPLLMESLLKVITNPKPRSKRWISSSFPEEEWDSPQAKLCDANYFVNNLLSPVRFRNALRAVPANALLVELAPHALLQAVLRRALPDAVTVGLMNRNESNQLNHLLISLGKIYCAGAQAQVGRLYPSVQWPVSRGTPGLASYVEWDHTTEWSVVDCSQSKEGDNIIEYNISSPDDLFLKGCVIDNVITFPTAAYLVLVWRVIAKIQQKKMEECPITMTNVQFQRSTIMSNGNSLHFIVEILGGTGEFTVSESGDIVMSGNVKLTEESSTELVQLVNSAREIFDSESDQSSLLTDDIYNELRLRGYQYDGVFRGIHKSNLTVSTGSLYWSGNWIAFIEAMFQFGFLGMNTRELCFPREIEHIAIDPTVQPMTKIIPVQRMLDNNSTLSGGVELRGIKTSLGLRSGKIEPLPKLQKYTFVPYISLKDDEYTCISHSKQSALLVNLQIVLENLRGVCLKVCELALKHSVEALLTPMVLPFLESESQVNIEASVAAGVAIESHSLALSQLNITTTRSLPKDCHILLASDVLGNQDASSLDQLINAAACNGILLLEEACGTSESPVSVELFHRKGLVLVSRQVFGSCEYVLFKRSAELPPKNKLVVVEVTDNDVEDCLNTLKDALKCAEREDMRVYVVERSSSASIRQQVASMRSEPGGSALRFYSLPDAVTYFSLDSDMYSAQVEMDIAFNMLHGSQWGNYRWLPLEDVQDMQVENAYVDALISGDVSSLRWIVSPLRHVLGKTLPSDVELCHIHYSSLNIHDNMQVTGQRDYCKSYLTGPNCPLGVEFSGLTLTGKRVMGIVESGALATTVLADSGFLWEVPPFWSLEEAATVPLAYAGAYYALVVRGRLQHGESILVHDGTSGSGQAAIAIALKAGCTVYTTVDSVEKRAFLHRFFAEVPDTNIGNSRDTSFEKLVRRNTCGRGVDLVLNSLTDDLLQASVRCLALGGRFLDMRNKDISRNGLLDALLGLKPDSADKKTISNLMIEGIANGTVQPLSSTVFKKQEVERAMSFMMKDQYIGKVLVHVHEDTRLVDALPRAYMYPDKCYILIEGLSCFGLELAQWLVTRGATKIVLTSRSSKRSGYQSWIIQRMEDMGIQVHFWSRSVTAAADACDLLKVAAMLGPVGGVFNISLLLEDAIIAEQYTEYFQNNVKPSIDGIAALDVASRNLSPELDHFVLFSSEATGRRSLFESNDGFANTTMKHIIEQRKADGLPALAIQWGPIGDVMMPSMSEVDSLQPVANKLGRQSITSCLNTLDNFLNQSSAIVSSFVSADEKSLVVVSRHGFVEVVAGIIGISDLDTVPESTQLVDLGMDSLMGAEIKQALEHKYDIVLSMVEIRDLTIARLRAITLH